MDPLTFSILVIWAVTAYEWVVRPLLVDED